MATGWPMKTTYANGDVYSASDVTDITGTVNLASGAQWAAGKNKIINAAFDNWQRGTSFSSAADSTYWADRFITNWSAGGATNTYSRQTFTAGTAPVSGYEGTYFGRAAATGATGTTQLGIGQRIENVRTLSGQTVTFSFWAKADSARSLSYYIQQNFGSGGSATVTASGTVATLTTSWVRYSVSVTLGAMTGKTIGTGNYLQFDIYFSGASGSPTLDTWGWQLEQASTATAFQTASGTIQGELALCQRYYEKSITQSSTPGGTNTGEMWFPNGTIANGETWQLVRFSVTKRTSPTVTTYSYSGTSGRAANDSGTNYGADSANVWRNGDSYAVIKNNSGSSMTVTSVRWVYCNWTADAEL